MQTDEQLKQIANDLYKEKIFCDRYLNNPETELTMVFMVFLFMDEETVENFQKKEPVFIYEYYDKSTRMQVNGYPTFFSCRHLNKEEYDKMIEYYNAIKSAVDGV
jgi:hypothetical protein